MAPLWGCFIYDGVRPRGLPEVYGTVWSQTPLWYRYVGALFTMGSDPAASRKFMARSGVRPHYGTGTWALYLRWGQTPWPPGLLGRWSDPNGLPLIFFGFRRGRLRVLRGELCLAGLDVLLNGLLRAFVDGTALLTAEGLHQAYVVGV